MVLRLPSAESRLAQVRKKLAQPHQKCPSFVQEPPQKRRLAQRTQMQVLPLKEKCAVPSRTSRWYACQYHRTCRSSLSHCELLCHSCVRVGLLTTGGGRLAGVDVADNDDVDVSLLLTADVVSVMFVMIRASASARGLPRNCPEAGWWCLPHGGGCVFES
jgi:hypothetical protein